MFQQKPDSLELLLPGSGKKRCFPVLVPRHRGDSHLLQRQLDNLQMPCTRVQVQYSVKARELRIDGDICMADRKLNSFNVTILGYILQRTSAWYLALITGI